MELIHPADSHDHTHDQAPAWPTRRRFISSLFAASVLARYSFGQAGGTVDRGDLAERYRRISEARDRAGLSEPFIGVTTDGLIIPDLYTIAPTQSSTDAVRNAAAHYMTTLTNQQLVRTMFPVDDPQWQSG